jgi:hypothetical protein
MMRPDETVTLYRPVGPIEVVAEYRHGERVDRDGG